MLNSEARLIIFFLIKQDHMHIQLACVCEYVIINIDHYINF